MGAEPGVGGDRRAVRVSAGRAGGGAAVLVSDLTLVLRLQLVLNQNWCLNSNWYQVLYQFEIQRLN